MCLPDLATIALHPPCSLTLRGWHGHEWHLDEEDPTGVNPNELLEELVWGLLLSVWLSQTVGPVHLPEMQPVCLPLQCGCWM